MEGKPINSINEQGIAVGNWGSILLGTSEKRYRTFFIVVPLRDGEAKMLISLLPYTSNNEQAQIYSLHTPDHWPYAFLSSNKP